MWRNREKDWYNAERRFIFATNTKALRKEWIRSIMIQKDPEKTSNAGEKPLRLELSDKLGSSLKKNFTSPAQTFKANNSARNSR